MQIFLSLAVVGVVRLVAVEGGEVIKLTGQTLCSGYLPRSSRSRGNG